MVTIIALFTAEGESVAGENSLIDHVIPLQTWKRSLVGVMSREFGTENDLVPSHKDTIMFNDIDAWNDMSDPKDEGEKKEKKKKTP